MSGKTRRLARIFGGDGTTVILAFDQGFEHGPAKYDGVDMRPERIFNIAAKGGADAVLVHKGAITSLEKPPSKDVSIICKISGRTTLSPEETEIQRVVTEVEDAISHGADAIGYSVYIGADRENENLAEFAKVYRACAVYGMPLVGFMYPRGKKVPTKFDLPAIRYAARVGAELDCDIIKTYYTGSGDTWKKVVKDAYKPVVAAGGPMAETEKAYLGNVQDIINAGGSGIAVGRNVWQREASVNVLKATVAIVHDGKTAAEAAKLL